MCEGVKVRRRMVRTRSFGRVECASQLTPAKRFRLIYGVDGTDDLVGLIRC